MFTKFSESGPLVTNVKPGTTKLTCNTTPVIHRTTTSFTDEERNRIIWEDAKRTFSLDCNRQLFKDLVTRLSLELGDYSQSMGYVASFLLLSHTVEESYTLMRQIQTQLPKYWTFQPTAVITDGYAMFHYVLSVEEPVVYETLLKIGVYPETYITKWFSGLFVHLVDYDTQVMIIDKVLKEGKAFLFKLAVEIMRSIKPVIMTCNVVKIFEAFKLKGVDVRALIAECNGEFGYELDELIEKAMENHIKSKLTTSGSDSDDELFTDSDDSDDE